MNKLFFILVLLLFKFSFVGSEVVSNEEKQKIYKLTQLLSSPKESWPGYSLTGKPTVVWLNNGHIYAFNLKSQNAQWQSINIEQNEILFSEQDHWDLSSMEINPNFEFENQTTYVFHLDLIEEDVEMPLLILPHEHFHSYQAKHFNIDEESSKNYHDHLNGTNVAMTQIEHMLLAKWLTTPPEGKSTVLKDFLAVHQERVAQLHPESLLWERRQQTMEGLADYVALRTLGFSGVWSEHRVGWHLFTTLQSLLDDHQPIEMVLKRRHYTVGSILAFILDNLQVQNWQQQVAQGKGLDELLEQTVKLTPYEQKQRYQVIVSDKQVQKTFNDVANCSKDYAEKMEKMLNEYQTLEGISISIAKPQNVHLSGAGENYGTFYLADGSTVSLSNTSSLASEDNNWTLEVKDSPFLFCSHDEVREFKISDEVAIVIDDSRYTFDDIVEPIYFNKLVLDNASATFKSINHPGMVNKENGKIQISYLRDN